MPETYAALSEFVAFAKTASRQLLLVNKAAMTCAVGLVLLGVPVGTRLRLANWGLPAN
jgi:hypothetical protein